MIMDMRRHCGIEQWRFFRDSDRVDTVEWYWAEPDARIFPLKTPFRNAIWSGGYPSNYANLGQVPASDFIPTNGINRWGYKGQCYIGKPDQWYHGLKQSDLANPPPVPECCRDSSTRPHLAISSRLRDAFAFSVGGEFEVEASLGCPIPDPLPNVLFGHWHTASGGQCDCYGKELQLSYGSVAFTDYSSIISPVLRTANAWYVDQLACDEIIRWVLYRGTDNAYHMQLQHGYPFNGDSLTDTGGFCFDTLSPVSGLAIFAGNSLCIFGEFGEFGVTFDETPAHRTDITIIGNFSAGGSLRGESVLTAVGNFSAHGSLPASISIGEIAEGDFSGGGSLHGQFSHLTELDMEGDFGGGGYFSVPIIYDETAEGDFSGGGDLQQG